MKGVRSMKKRVFTFGTLLWFWTVVLSTAVIKFAGVDGGTSSPGIIGWAVMGFVFYLWCLLFSLVIFYPWHSWENMTLDQWEELWKSWD